jgi:hypothetical protein
MAYSYKLQCNSCDRKYLAYGKYDRCTNCASQNSTFIEDVLDVAVDVASAYLMADMAGDIVDSIGDLVGSLFD